MVPAEDVLDRFALGRLLAPLGDGAGPDPRDDPGFLDVKDARAEARVAERDALVSADPEADPLRAGQRAWARAAEGAEGLLASRSKDLQLAAWLTEAWLRTDGFAGLAAGLQLMAGLVEGFWDEGLHPQEDEDGPETRVAPLFGLFGRGEAGTLLQPVKLLPLTDRPGDPVALWTIENARAQTARHDDPDVREELEARRRERIDGINDAIARASPDFDRETAAAIAVALAAIDRLMAAVDARTSFGRFGSQVARPLEDVRDAMRAARGGGDAVSDAPPPPVAQEPAVPEPDGATPAPAPASGAAMTRASALATLLEVAAFFDRNEPQSLVAAGLRDVVRRAELPVDALLRELLPEDEQRSMFLLRAGIRATAPNDGSAY